MPALPDKPSAVAVLAVAAIAFAGCGANSSNDGDSGGKSHAAKPSAAEMAALRAELDPICAKAATRSAKALGAKSIRDFERYGRQAGAAVKAFRAELRPVKPPSELAAGWQSWLAAIDDDISTYDLVKLAGAVNNQSAVLQQTPKLSAAKPGKAARALGIPECAEATDRAAHTFSAPAGQ